MGEDSAPTRPAPWRLADIVNFEYFLHRERESGAPLSPNADVREKIAALEDDAASPLQARRTVFRFWLDKFVRREPAHTLPGNAVTSALKTACAIFSLFAFSGGVSLVLSLLERPGKSLNVQVFFAATVLLQLALLALLFLGGLLRRAFSGAGALSLLHQAVRAVVSRLSNKTEAGRKFAGGFQNFARSYRSLVAWPIFAISQTAAIFFNLGLLAGFFACLLFLDLTFYWESTFGPAMDHTLYRITELISLPWSWIRPEWTPSFDLIQDRGSDPRFGHMWYSFLLSALLVWGLLPRLLLRFAAAIGNRRALAAVTFNQRHHRDLWRDLTAVSIHAQVAAPTDGAIVLNWNGIEVDQDDLHSHVIRQLRVNPIESHIVGVGTTDTDDETLYAVSQRRREQRARDTAGSSIVVLAEAWGLVPKRMREFHGKIRGHLGRDLPLRFLIVGAPAADTVFTPPDAEEIRVWEEFVDSLNDPLTDLRPFRKT